MVFEPVAQERQLSPESPADGASAAAALHPMPPHAQFLNYLPDRCRADLTDWAISQESAFKPASIFYGQGGQQSKHDPEVRRALKLATVGPFEQLLRDKLLDDLV